MGILSWARYDTEGKFNLSSPNDKNADYFDLRLSYALCVEVISKKFSFCNYRYSL